MKMEEIYKQIEEQNKQIERWDLEKLEYIQITLQAIIKDADRMGDHLIDLESVKKSLNIVEDIIGGLKP